jgi:predicted nucleotide-binding protein
VIFELGFFYGKLGRGRVCVLHKPGTEILSDIAGVVYVPMDDAGAWRQKLATELQQVLPTIDKNNVV